MTDLEPCSEVRARELVDTIKRSVLVARDAIREAWTGRAWVALGYTSWEQMCDTEFGMRVQLPAGERAEIARDLREAEMSLGAIGSALGVDASTVGKDLRNVGKATLPEFVTATDGRRLRTDMTAKATEARHAAHQSGFVGTILRNSVLDLIAAIQALEPDSLNDADGLPERALIIDRINALHAASDAARRRLTPLRRIQ